jgi:branched-chain amino acid transport system permease protein
MAKTGRICFLSVLAVVLLVLPFTGVNDYYLQVMVSFIPQAMMGLAFALALKVGLPRFDIVAWQGIGAYTCAELMLKAHWSFWPTILVAGIVAMALGWLCYRAAMPRGMMVFLLFGMVIVLAVYQLFGSLSFFGGWGGTGILPKATLGGFKFVSRQSVYYLGLVFLVVNVIVYYLLYKSRIGRAWNAIGSSLGLAKSVGVNVVQYRMANILIGNFFLAVSGCYLIACNQLANPATFSFGNSVGVMMYVVVGGLRFALAGPLAGAVIITLVPEYLRFAQQWAPVLTGAVTILIIVFLPSGLLGILEDRVRPWFGKRRLLARFGFGGERR